MRNLILASSSIYRKSLLKRLQIEFKCVSPDIDESPRDDETALDQALRLADEKAQAVALQFPDATVIGSDQVAELCFTDASANARRPVILGKPGNHQCAVEQLSAQSGQTVKFYTAVTVLSGGLLNRAMDITEVRFRHLSNAEIEDYLQADKPYNCAGSFKAEALGISLFESVISHDPTALIGLPLIKVSQLLRQVENETHQ